MEAQIAAWLASKLGKAMLYGLAAAAVVLIPVSAAQYVQIHGWPIFGGGLKAEVAGLQGRVENLRLQIDAPVTGYRARLAAQAGRAAAYQSGLNTCNASIDMLKRQGLAATAAADARVAEARRRGDRLQQQVGVLQAAKPRTGDLCADAETLIMENVQ